MAHKFLVLTVKKWLKSVYIYGSYRKIKTGISLFLDQCVHTAAHSRNVRETHYSLCLPVHQQVLSSPLSTLYTLYSSHSQSDDRFTSNNCQASIHCALS